MAALNIKRFTQFGPRPSSQPHRPFGACVLAPTRSRSPSCSSTKRPSPGSSHRFWGCSCFSLQGAIPKSSVYRCHCSENHDCTVPQRGWATSILSIYIHAVVIVLLPPNTAGTTIMMAAIVVFLQSSSPPPMWVRRTALPKVTDRREVALPCLPKPRSGVEK